ncbi:sarcosine oxidase subunit delta [Pseudoroseicyclus tamaricis]|uniref:Sarcosine oxidase subunit delta n=1 Tax=Pseudoroseicyclus tamaricis TaxID=2705421 RepID=A0A6B2JES7_9RHOB|nr:sarcosine oxidase subunit delta [Pseudoroseicyclus tamaricis]NDU99412.1 sarcosine oxidase subunit delta [Pseudoroseicyclus tamaricis]
MRIRCPHCGERDRREFTWMGAALERPGGSWGEEMHAYVFLRENPAGPLAELWHHDPCGAMVRAVRDTRTHEMIEPGDAP